MGNNFFKNTKNLLFFSVIFALITSIYSCNPIINNEIKPQKTLIIAAKENNLSEIKSLLKNGADINSKDKDENTALNIAIFNKNREIIKFLVESKADLETRNINYDLPIILAVRNYDIETVKLLIKNGVDIYSKEINGNSLLHLACMFENKQLIEFFLGNNMDITITNKKGQTPIELLNKPEIFNFFIDKLSYKNLYPSADVNSIMRFLIEKTDDFITKKFTNQVEKIEPKYIDINNAFILSISEKNKELIEFFFNKGADINFNNATPLMNAINSNDVDIVEFIINKKPNINLKNSRDLTPLMLSIQINNINIIKLLINSGVDINLATKKNSTPLMISCSSSQFETIKALIDSGADVNLKDSEGWNALMFAIQNSESVFQKPRNNVIDIVKLIISKGSDVNSYINSNFNDFNNRNIEKGATPLMMATNIDDIEIVKALIDSGADVNLKDFNGHTALTYTIFNNVGGVIGIKKDIATLLIEKGSSLNFMGFYNTNYKGQINPNFKGSNFLEYVINDLELLKVIEKNRPDSFDLPINPLGHTPLIHAIEAHSNIDILEFIIKQTKNINLVDNENKTALDHAIKLDNKKAIDLLKQYGAK